MYFIQRFDRDMVSVDMKEKENNVEKTRGNPIEMPKMPKMPRIKQNE